MYALISKILMKIKSLSYTMFYASVVYDRLLIFIKCAINKDVWSKGKSSDHSELIPQRLFEHRIQRYIIIQAVVPLFCQVFANSLRYVAV